MKKLIMFFKSKTDSAIIRYYLFVFLRDFSFIGAVLIPFFTQWGKISLFQVQLLQSWFMLWILLLEVPTGAIADYLGRKYSLALGGLMAVFGALIYGSISHFEAFLIGEILFATSNALMSGADQALIYDILKKENRENESRKIFGRAYSFHMLGILVSAPIGSVIASKVSLNSPMLFYAIPALISVLVALSIKEERATTKISESRRYLNIIKTGFSYFYNHKPLRLLAIDGILVASSAYFVIWFYQLLLQRISFPVFYFGFVHAFLVGSEILISSNFVFWEKILGGAKKYFRVTAIFTAVSFILVGLFPNIITILIFIIFAGGFGLSRLELVNAYMNKLIPSAERATVLSSISMFRRFALVILNPVVGFIANQSVNIALIFVGLIPLLIFYFSPVKKEMLEVQNEK